MKSFWSTLILLCFFSTSFFVREYCFALDAKIQQEISGIYAERWAVINFRHAFNVGLNTGIYMGLDSAFKYRPEKTTPELAITFAESFESSMVKTKARELYPLKFYVNPFRR